MHFPSRSARGSLPGIAGACAFAALLAGCAAYRPQPLEPASVAEAFEARRLDDPHLQSLILEATGRSASPSWDLATLTIAGLYFDPRLEVARAKWHVSRAAIVAAAARPNPRLDVSVGRATNPPAGEPAGLADLRFGIPIETAGKREHRIEVSERLSQAARLEIRGAAWKMRARIRDALLDCSAAATRSAILARQVDAEAAIVAMVERRRALGAASSTEVALRRAALARARIDEAASDAHAAQSRARLAAAIGIPEEALDKAAIRFPHPTSSAPGTDRARSRRDALFHRSDVAAALERHAAAESALQLEIARQYPDVEIGPGYSYDTGTNKFSIGVVGIALPLLDRNEGPIAQARARRDQAAKEFEALQDRVLGEVDAAVASVRGARRAVRLADAEVGAERARSRRMERRFEAGDEDRLALASSRSGLFSAELSRAQAALALGRAIGTLEDATQTPLLDGGLDSIDPRIVEGERP